MSKPIDPDEYWAARGKRNIKLAQMGFEKRSQLGLDGEFRRLQNEYSMGLFVRGQSPELRLRKENVLNTYEAALSNGEKPAPPWVEKSSTEYR